MSQLYEVVDTENADEVIYEAYLIMVDSGSIFRHGSLDEVRVNLANALGYLGPFFAPIIPVVSEAPGSPRPPRPDE